MGQPLRETSAPNRRPGLALFGAACLLAGLVGGALLLVAVYGGSPAAERRALQFGLGGCLLASAVAQILVLVGGWALWSGLRRHV